MIERSGDDMVLPGTQMRLAVRATQDAHKRVRLADKARVTDYELKRAERGWAITRESWRRIATALELPI